MIASIKTFFAKRETQNSTREVGKQERIAFYVASFFRDMSYALVGGFLMFFYIDILGFAGTAALIVIPIVTRVWDGVNDPIMGALYDRRTYGTSKAKPVFKFTSVISSVFLILLFFAPPFSSDPNIDYIGKAIFAVVTYICFETFHTLNGTAFMSLYNSISRSTDERTQILSVARIFSLAGTGAVGGLLPILLGFFRSDDIRAKTYLYLGFACFVSLSFIIYNFIMYRYVHERGITPCTEKQKFSTIFKSFGKNKPLFTLIISVCFLNIINTSTLNLYFFTYNMGSPAVQTLLYVFTVPSFLIGAYLVPILVKKFDKRTIYICTTVFFAGCSGIILCLGHIPNLSVLFAITLFSNIALCIRMTLYWCMIADTVDYGEWVSGHKNDGIIYSIEGCVSKVVGGIGAFAIGAIIIGINFVPNALVQTEETMKALFYIPHSVALVTSLVSCIPIFFYKISKKQQSKISDDLILRRALVETESADNSKEA